MAKTSLNGTPANGDEERKESFVELYRKYRPKRLKDVLGQAEAVRMLTQLLDKGKVPHTLLFTGPSGCGKTTLARIMAKKLGCSSDDFTEINSAGDGRGIDTMRDIKRMMSGAPMFGSKCRVWLFDEFHKSTNDCQNSALKLFEDTPSHVYFMLCSSEPNKIIKAIQTRCTQIPVKEVQPSVMRELLASVCAKEGIKISDEVASRILEVADGSPRKALVLLHQIMDIDDEQKQLDCILSSDTKRAAIEIARALLNKAKWSDVAKLIKAVDEEPESIRRLILGYASTVLLGGGAAATKAFQMIANFESNFYDSGKAGLIRACYETCNG